MVVDCVRIRTIRLVNFVHQPRLLREIPILPIDRIEIVDALPSDAASSQPNQGNIRLRATVAKNVVSGSSRKQMIRLGRKLTGSGWSAGYTF
jgi:hypothetical protein